MFFAVVTTLLFIGLYCFGLALKRLWLLDQMPSQPIPVAPPEETKPRLTKLGRPIEEIKLNDLPNKFLDTKINALKLLAK